MPADFRFAICNEIFGDLPFPRVCAQAAEAGFEGLELTSHLFAEQNANPVEIRTQIEDAGLRYVGLHWLLVSPPGLHITSDDPGIARRSWDHVRRMVDVSAQLAKGGLSTVVIGSGRQRASNGGDDRERAYNLFLQELGKLAPYAEMQGVTLLVEAIPSSHTDLINRLEDAVAVVCQIGSPAVQTMFDVHNALDETEPDVELVRRFSRYIRHIHVNEKNGAEPGTGDYEFGSLFDALREVGYAGWISVEAFDFSRAGSDIASRAIARLRASNRS